jgi:RNA polymerase sigma factor (sigma-70 family)
MAAAHVDAPERAGDEPLLARIRQGDRAAFDQLYERYFPRVYRFIDRRDAPFAAWVFGVARRTLAARFKRRRHDTVPLGDDEPEGVDSLGAVQRAPDPHAVYEYNERLSRLDAAIERDLSSEQWELFQLHHLENRSIQDIARETSKSEDAVKSHLYRARRLLLAR